MIDEIVQDKRITELEDKLKDHERRIVELKHELDECKEKYSELLRNRNETQHRVSSSKISHLHVIEAPARDASAVSQREIAGDLDLDLGVRTARDVNLKRQIAEVQKAGEEVLSAAKRLSHGP
jgi:predicted RNase H-like nuclease (RuvC/YqgF family)